jgi:ribosomal protein L5
MYPNFDHNGKRIAAWNLDERLPVGSKVFLTLSVDGRGNSSFTLHSEDWCKHEIREDKRVTTAEGSGVIVSVNRDSGIAWVDRDIMTASEMGHKGGSSKSDPKRAAAIENGRKGGRPKKSA